MAMKARYTVAYGEVIAQKRSGTRSLLVPDPLGSTVALFDAAQTKTDTWSYFPYGEVKTRTGTTTLPFQFVGSLGYYNDSSSKTYVRARYLDTGKGRWVTEDPIGFDESDSNLYSYVANNATSQTDPAGLYKANDPCKCNPKGKSCNQICDMARRLPKCVDPRNGAGPVCCGTTECACIFPYSMPPEYRLGKCPGLDLCITIHETGHFPDVSACVPGKGLWRPPWRPGVDKTLSECRLHSQGYQCLLNARKYASADCQQQFNWWLDRIGAFLEFSCKDKLNVRTAPVQGKLAG